MDLALFGRARSAANAVLGGHCRLTRFSPGGDQSAASASFVAGWSRLGRRHGTRCVKCTGPGHSDRGRIRRWKPTATLDSINQPLRSFRGAAAPADQHRGRRQTPAHAALATNRETIHAAPAPEFGKAPASPAPNRESNDDERPESQCCGPVNAVNNATTRRRSA